MYLAYRLNVKLTNPRPQNRLEFLMFGKSGGSVLCACQSQNLVGVKASALDDGRRMRHVLIVTGLGDDLMSGLARRHLVK